MCCRNRQQRSQQGPNNPILLSMGRAAYKSYKDEKAKSLERQQLSHSPRNIDSAYNSSSSRASSTKNTTTEPAAYDRSHNYAATSNTAGSSIDSAIAMIGPDGQHSKRESRQECIDRHLSCLAALDLSGTATPDSTASDSDAEYERELDVKAEKEFASRGRRREPRAPVAAAPPPRYEDVVDLASVNDKLVAVCEQQRAGSSSSASASAGEGSVEKGAMTWRERWAEKKAERLMRREERWADWEARRAERRANGGGCCGRRC